MGIFSKKQKSKPSLETDLGVFTYQDEYWCAEATNSTSGVALVVYSNLLEISLIQEAKELLAKLPDIQKQAIEHINQNEPDSQNADYGEMVLETLNITSLGDAKFELCFAYTSWPDGAVNVLFKDGSPVEIHLSG